MLDRVWRIPALPLPASWDLHDRHECPPYIARVRPQSQDYGDEHFFVANDAPDFDSEAGAVWTVIDTPFPDSPANAGSVPRSGWEAGDAAGVGRVDREGTTAPR